MKLTLGFIAGFITGLAIYRAPLVPIFRDQPPDARGLEAEDA